MENPWQTPEAPLEGGAPSEGSAGPLLPFEEAGRPLSTRLWETVTLILGNPEEAGHRLGARKVVGSAVAFFAWVGLPLQWIGQLIIVSKTAVDPGQNDFLFRLAHLPPPPPPSPEQLSFARAFAWMGVAFAPVAMALGLLFMGLLAHLGLWMVKGLGERRGMEVTFRTLLYVSASTAWLGFLNAFFVFLPGPGLRLAHQVLSVGLALGVLTFQGLVLGHAHGVRPWKGVVGLLLPPFILICFVACCLGAGLAAAGGLPK